MPKVIIYKNRPRADVSENIFKILYDPDPYHDKDVAACCRSIGAVAVAWAAFEYHVNSAILEIGKIDQSVGLCITSQFATSQTRARALLAVYREKGGDEDIAKRVNKFFVNSVEPIGRERNRTVHDPIMVNNKDKICRLHITADRRLEMSAKESLEHAQQLLEKIVSLTVQFGKLAREMKGSLQSSEEK